MPDASSTVTIPQTSPIHFLNIEYFFRLLYGLFSGTHSITAPNYLELALHIWLFVTIIAYVASLGLIGLFVTYSMRLFQIRAEEAHLYHMVAHDEAHKEMEHSRWAYIMQLVETGHESDWRQAIIEADIMLDEVLTRQGYEGNSIGDKLKQANPNRFHTLNNAWEAHKVRNDIAHSGSAYQLSDQIAYRTIKHYEAVFREFGEI